MKKRTIIVLISIFIVLGLTFTAYSVLSGQKETNKKDNFVEKTINKESMKTDADCGVVSVKMLLDFYDIHVPYAELEKKLKTTTEGTKWEDIQNYLRTIDSVEMIEFKDNMSKAEEYAENGYPLFICWDVDGKPEWSHYSILIAIDKNSVWMLDPEQKKSLSQYSLDYFLPCWKNENYWFCVLEMANNRKALLDNAAN